MFIIVVICFGNKLDAMKQLNLLLKVALLTHFGLYNTTTVLLLTNKQSAK